ncbi:MAG: AcrR family transcriptional regulator [Polyangiales bacterium]|jgi:AcrR family transcriptional regulator
MRSDGAKKKELIYETAMDLFREHGFEATTMRAIAKAAKISLGSAYHYYPSKVAIVFDYYYRGQDHHEAAADAAFEAAGGDVARRLTNLVRAKIDLIRGDRQLLGHIAAAVVTPGDALSAFAPETRDIRERSIALFDRAVGGLNLGPHRRAISVLLWVAHLGIMLYLVHDQSENQTATDKLIASVAQQLTPLLMLANTPMAEPLIAGVTKTLSEAGLIPEGENGLLESD